MALTPVPFVSTSVSFVALLALSSAAVAAPLAYSSSASFLAASSAAATDTFDDLSITMSTAAPMTRAVGNYVYSIGASDGDSLFGAGSDPDHWLSVNNATTSIVIGGFSAGVRAIGGLFFGSDLYGAFAPGTILLTATDASGSTTRTLADATTGSFFGFVSSSPLTSLTITSVQPAASFVWPTVNNLVLAAAPVPEPASAALVLAGLGVLGWLARRRGKPIVG